MLCQRQPFAARLASSGGCSSRSVPRQRDAGQGDLVVVVQRAAVFVLAGFAVLHFLHAAVGIGQLAAALDLERIRHYRFVIQMRLGQFASDLRECPEVGSGFHAGGCAAVPCSGCLRSVRGSPMRMNG